VDEAGKTNNFRGFFGNYQHTLDAKGRVFVPSKFRAGFETTFMLTKGLDRCLVAYTLDEWDKMTLALDRIHYSDEDAREFARHLYSNAMDCEVDKQGRISIPQTLRDYAAIAKDVCFAGMKNYVELWDYDSWKVVNGRYDNHSDILGKKMQKYFGAGAVAAGAVAAGAAAAPSGSVAASAAAL